MYNSILNHIYSLISMKKCLYTIQDRKIYIDSKEELTNTLFKYSKELTSEELKEVYDLLEDNKINL